MCPLTRIRGITCSAFTRHGKFMGSNLQTKVVQSKGQLSAIVRCSMANINHLWDGSMDKCKVHGLVPCCGQDGYRAQVLQLPQIHIHIKHLNFYVRYVSQSYALFCLDFILFLKLTYQFNMFKNIKHVQKINPVCISLNPSIKKRYF